MTTRKLLPTKRIYGYVRVSTSGQNPDRQVYNIHEWVKENYGEDIYNRVRSKIDMGIPKAEVARQFNISRATLHRYLKGEVNPDE